MSLCFSNNSSACWALQRNINWIMTSSKCTLCMRSLCTLICTMPGLKRDESQMHKGPPYLQIRAGLSAVAASLLPDDNLFFKFFFWDRRPIWPEPMKKPQKENTPTLRGGGTPRTRNTAHGLTTILGLSIIPYGKVCGIYSIFFQVLQLLSVRFTQQNLCCISKSTMKHHQKLYRNLDFSSFS